MFKLNRKDTTKTAPQKSTRNLAKTLLVTTEETFSFSSVNLYFMLRDHKVNRLRPTKCTMETALHLKKKKQIYKSLVHLRQSVEYATRVNKSN